MLTIFADDNDRTRSRSPRAPDARDHGGARRRSPPRGSRGGGAAGSAPNGTHHAGNKKDKAAPAAETAPTVGRTQPSSREWTRRVKSQRPKVGGADADDNAMDVDGEEDAEAAEMERVMGFSSFSSTMDTKVPGNDKNYAVRKEKKTEYRQYMNRQGGFNRPLSPSRS